MKQEAEDTSRKALESDPVYSFLEVLLSPVEAFVVCTPSDLQQFDPQRPQGPIELHCLVAFRDPSSSPVTVQKVDLPGIRALEWMSS
jgi:hypothetical protein